jgi:hypothetical protein
VLVVVPRPEEIVAEAVALAHAYGVVAFHEADFITHMCDPPLRAWNRLTEAMVAYAQISGTDPFLGRRLPRMLANAGVANVHVKPLVHVYPPGHSRRPILVQFAENLRDRMLAAAVISEDEFADSINAVERHLADPGTTVFSHLFVQAWGHVS